MIRRVALASIVGVLAASGSYALIYLFRWEWHRAIITALFFVAAEIGLGLAVLLRRLTRIEERLDELDRSVTSTAPSAIDPAVLDRIRESAPPAPNPFAWLDPRGPGLSVFLPFLLGVGALASGLAWVVEQLARRSTTPALERRLAQGLAPLALPAGGLLGVAPLPEAGVARKGPARRWLLPVGATLLVSGLAVGTIDWLGDALQTRPDARESGVSTRIELQMRGTLPAERPTQTAGILWGTCSHTLHGKVGSASVHDLGGGRIEVLVPTHIGTHAEARVRGCLQDAVVDRVQASVVALESVPRE